MEYLGDMFISNWFLYVKIGLCVLIATLLTMGIRFSIKEIEQK